MKELLEKVERELEKVGDKGLTSSNLDTTYKLIDIYKDIKESEYYAKQCEELDTYDARGGSRGGGGNRGGGRSGGRSGGRYRGDGERRYDGDYDRYEHYYPWGEREERYFDRMRQGMDNYAEGRGRYREGSSQEKMIDGIELAMTALVSFVETLYDHVETPKEKDIIREHIEKLKKL